MHAPRVPMRVTFVYRVVGHGYLELRLREKDNERVIETVDLDAF